MPTTDGLRPVWRIETVTPGSHKFTYVSADTSEPEVLGSHDLVHFLSVAFPRL